MLVIDIRQYQPVELVGKEVQNKYEFICNDNDQKKIKYSKINKITRQKLAIRI